VLSVAFLILSLRKSTLGNFKYSTKDIYLDSASSFFISRY